MLLLNENVHGSNPVTQSTTLKENNREIQYARETKYLRYLQVGNLYSLENGPLPSGKTIRPHKVSVLQLPVGHQSKMNHHRKNQWPNRTEITSNKSLNIVNEPQFVSEKISFRPLHIEMGWMKQLIKSYDKEINYLKDVCSFLKHTY